MKIPICERCGKEMHKIPGSEVIYGPGKELEGSLQRLGPPLAHRHSFQCQACIPPYVTVEVPYDNTTEDKYEIPEPGQLYKHYKGVLFNVVCTANSTETSELLVIYYPTYELKAINRACSIKKWNGEAMDNKTGKLVPRFEKFSKNLCPHCG